MSLAGSIGSSRIGRRAASRPTLPSLVALKKLKPTRKGVAITLIIAVALAAATWALVRNSSMVAVEQVQVVGLSGYYDKEARRAVVAEAEQMTTMNVDEQRLADAASAFVDIEGVRVETDFPHELTVFVDARRPVAAAKVGGQTVGLAAGGMILYETSNLSGLPTIEVAGHLKNDHVTDAKALAAVKVLGAAQDVFLRKIAKVSWGRNGLVVVLDKGVELYFGDSTKARAKWRAVAAVLADPTTRGVKYIDLRAPERPAVGGLGAAPTTVKPSVLDPSAPPVGADPAATVPNSTVPDQTATAPQPATPPAQQPAQQQAQQAPAASPQPAPAAGGASPPAAGQ